MMNVSHAFTMNGRINDELKTRNKPPEDEIRRRVLLLDGTQRYSLGLWALPAGIPFDRVDLSAWPQEYIQAAGSDGRFTVEVRKIIGGLPQQSVIGRDANPDDLAAPSEVIRWDGCENIVRQNEVFDAEEVGDIFVAYYGSGAVPSTYVERAIVV